MATVLSTKHIHGPTKLKRPPPTLQTSINGINSSTSSPSPSLSSKRPPPNKQTSNSAAMNGVSINGITPRVSNRQRRESHRPGDLHTRQHRNGSIELRSARLDGGLENSRDLNRKVSPRPHGRASKDCQHANADLLTLHI